MPEQPMGCVGRTDRGVTDLKLFRGWFRYQTQLHSFKVRFSYIESILNVTWGISSFIHCCTTFVSAYSFVCYSRCRDAKLKKRHSPFFQGVYHLMALRSLQSRTVVKNHDTQGSLFFFFFLVNKLQWKTTIIFYLCAVCGGFCASAAELGHCDRDCMAHNTVNMHYLAL